MSCPVVPPSGYSGCDDGRINCTQIVGPKGERAEEPLYDRELDQFPPEMRWREWMLRVEAVIFASAEPVSRETLARAAGKTAALTC